MFLLTFDYEGEKYFLHSGRDDIYSLLITGTAYSKGQLEVMMQFIEEYFYTMFYHTMRRNS